MHFILENVILVTFYRTNHNRFQNYNKNKSSLFFNSQYRILEKRNRAQEKAIFCASLKWKSCLLFLFDV